MRVEYMDELDFSPAETREWENLPKSQYVAQKLSSSEFQQFVDICAAGCIELFGS
jgi:hypothetical protein